MSSTSNKIEMYLKAMLDRAGNGVLEIQRSELADVFDCVPSQINYVLGTRFTPAHGYIVETRRGGGGFLRIIRLSFDQDLNLQEFFQEVIGEELSQNESDGLLKRLHEEGLLTRRELAMLMQITSTLFFNELGFGEQGSLRAKILEGSLAALMRKDL